MSDDARAANLACSASQPASRSSIPDTCFIACVRPAMMLGVQAEALLLNVVGSVIVSGWVGLHSWHKLVYMAVLIPSIHFAMRYAFARDHNWFRVKILGLQTKGYGTATWGGSTATPIPARWPGKARDLSVGL